MAEEVVKVDVDGIAVDVDVAYARSWKAIKCLSRAHDTTRSTGERALYMVEYCDHACPNSDEVFDEVARRALADGGGDPHALIVQTIQKAVAIAASKN